MKRQQHWYIVCLCAVLACSLQGCLGEGASPFQNKNTDKNGRIGINQSDVAKFQGKIYFTLDRNLYVLDGKLTLTQLTHTLDVRDPAVSPDGKWIAFIIHYKYYADLVYRSTNPADQTIRTVVTGKGHYFPGGEGANSYYWFAQPTWSADSSQLLFLSDLQKDHIWGYLGGAFGSYFLDMQVFSLPINVTLTATQAIQEAQPVAYANFGDGGDRDPSYRPQHAQQVIYTHYSYDVTGNKQVVQLMLEDSTRIARPHHPPYHPGINAGPGAGFPGYDPAVALTPYTPDLVNFQPAFSPDGSLLAYVRREDTTNRSIYLMPVAEHITGDPDNPAFDPASPDNTQKALQPYVQSQKLLTQPMLSQPLWSPRGDQLIFYGYTNTSFDIWLATLTRNAKSGAYSLKPQNLVQLTQAAGHLDADSRACWTS